MLIVSQKQIIDVTKDCTFEWYTEPKPCRAYLEVNDATGNFSEEETITGQTSGATASVFSYYADGNRIYIESINGNFQTGETVQGQSSGQTATVDKFITERSYPDNIIKGNFPNSIISGDIDDYLEFESTRDGSGYSVILKVAVPKNGNYIVMPVFGVGNRIDTYTCFRQMSLSTRNSIYSPLFTLGSIYYNCLFPNRYAGVLGPTQLFPENYNNEFIFIIFKQLDKGTYRWRIHNIKILKLIL